MSAALIDLSAADWRDPDGVLVRRAVRDWTSHARAQRQPHGWRDLESIALTDKRDALRAYRRLGLKVHALHGVAESALTAPPYGRCTCGKPTCGKSTGKHPIDKGWDSSPFDFERIDRALIRDGRLNLGWRMGLQPNGWLIVCFDVDGPLTLLAPLEAKHGKLPETLTATSGRGFHLFFRLAKTSAVPGNVKLAGMTEIDIRSVGGQVVIGPSKHYSGARYRWINCIEPAELDL